MRTVAAPAERGAGRPLLVVAADLPGADQALELAGRLQGLPLWLKVGLELFTATGPLLLERLAACDLPVFLDLKFHDIPNTVQGAVRSAAGLGARMLTVHAGGGRAMCRAAVAGREQARDLWRERNKREENAPWPLLMGVTVLTSEGGDPETIRRLVVQRALLARESGLDGVVCSGLEAAAVKEACGAEFLCLCPGIRFAGYAGGDDQSRVCTPSMAARAGADFLVMGRPITGAPDPARAARAALKELGTEA